MIDLHLHLDGSLTPEELILLADRSGVTLPCRDTESLQRLLTVEPDCRDLGEYLEKFELPLQVLQTEETLTLSVRSLIKRLAQQGLCYAEIRFAPQLHQRRGLTQQQVVAAAVAGLAQREMPAQLILCCMRGDDNLQANWETVRTAKDFLGQGVCAVDLAGNEAAYPTKDFKEVFELARELAVPYIIHAGEAAGPESVRQALSLGARRIGHGIRSVKDLDLLALLQEKQIPLELCFTSNLQTKAAKDAKDYPLCRFLELGIAVTINTDNMTVSGTDLRKEYTLLQQQLSFSEEMLLAVACNAADAAFVSTDLSKELRTQILAHFSSWLKGSINK